MQAIQNGEQNPSTLPLSCFVVEEGARYGGGGGDEGEKWKRANGTTPIWGHGELLPAT